LRRELIQRPIIGQTTPTYHFQGGPHLPRNRSGNVLPHLPPPGSCPSIYIRSPRSVRPLYAYRGLTLTAFIAAVPLVLGEAYVLIMFFTKGFLLGPAGLDLFDAVRHSHLDVELY